MITGFNTNVRYSGLQFHVQTEDSGRAHPHVISHLYHGGTILASEKTEYADIVESENLDAQVRAMMEEQHKGLLRRLKHGEFDKLIDERIKGGTAASQDATASPSPPLVTGVAPLATADPASSPSQPPTQPATVEHSPGATTAVAAPAGRAFGAGVPAVRRLDELIVDYLVEKARTPDSRG